MLRTHLGLSKSPHARAISRLSEGSSRYKVENSQGIVGGEITVAVDLSQCHAVSAGTNTRHRAECRDYVIDIDVAITIGVASVLR